MDAPEEYLFYFLGGILYQRASAAIEEDRHLCTTKVTDFKVEDAAD